MSFVAFPGPQTIVKCTVSMPNEIEDIRSIQLFLTYRMIRFCYLVCRPYELKEAAQLLVKR